MMPTLRTTITLLTLADSLIPTTRTTVIRSTMATAGRFTRAPVAWKPVPCEQSPACVVRSAASHQRNGAPVSDLGRLTPKSLRSSTKYPLQPTPTVLAPIEYSSTRSQPMIQAMSSPRVAYAYVYALPATGTAAAISA